ncbi:unnamed protein product [Ceratitis capitata]|uniref:(Mediterranean fruit fly) hypothetical protein n=1 Tax=Ceratitis capitata TaxID=7213 RepID=A0A811VFR4_CERCA|nr:unnamed protein product [Ceratitis capitata]
MYIHIQRNMYVGTEFGNGANNIRKQFETPRHAISPHPLTNAPAPLLFRAPALAGVGGCGRQCSLKCPKCSKQRRAYRIHFAHPLPRKTTRWLGGRSEDAREWGSSLQACRGVHYSCKR